MLELYLLGPVEAWSNGHLTALAPLERNLLALLALSAGSVVSTERIIDGLWGDRAPAAPRARVQGLVSALRRKIGGGVVTRNPGYLLERAELSSDLDRCEELAQRARQAQAPADRAALLRDAVQLWRGEPLDGVWAPGTTASRARLAELRISLTEEYFEAELTLGRHAGLVQELVAMTAAHPLRERLTGQLMVALYRSNRQAEALHAYAALRDRLAEELGSDPCADLRALHTTILRGQAPGPEPTEAPRSAEAPSQEHRPAQMPASVGHFVGRDADLAALTAALPGPADEPRALLISGAGGLGKTALAVRWAHAVADRFPDGQIFVDLRGSRDSALSPGSALGAALLALGLATDQLPFGVDERAALFRTLTHGRRLLLVADDAGSVGQLLPLVPPTSGSLIVATSRVRLTALTAHHAVCTVTINPLTSTASRELLSAIVGRDRLHGDGAAELVQLCGGWPLAIRLAGATLAARPKQSLSSFADELRERVDVLSVPDDPRTVRAALAAAHAGLEPAAERLFAQLGVLPGRSVPLHLAAAVADVSALRARQLLDELISANLVVEIAPDRYRCHDTIWRYARRCGAALANRTVVEERTIRWYLATLDAVRRGEAPGILAAEAANLPDLVRWVAARGNPMLTWQLVSSAFAAGAALPVSAYELGLAAARRLDDRSAPALGEAHAYLGLALLREPVHRYSSPAPQPGGPTLHNPPGHRAAIGCLTVAAELLEAGDGPVPAVVSFALGLLSGHDGRPAEGRAYLERALLCLDPAREPISYAITLLGYADLRVRAGAAEQGTARFAQALILCEATGGMRFDLGRESLDPFVVTDLLAYVTSCLPSPRIAGADWLLARQLLDVCHAVGVATASVAHARVPLQRTYATEHPALRRHSDPIAR